MRFPDRLRAAAVLLVLAVLTPATSCSSAPTRPGVPYAPRRAAVPTAGRWEWTLTAARDTFFYGAPVWVRASLRNVSPDTLFIDARTDRGSVLVPPVSAAWLVLRSDAETNPVVRTSTGGPDFGTRPAFAVPPEAELHYYWNASLEYGLPPDHGIGSVLEPGRYAATASVPVYEFLGDSWGLVPFTALEAEFVVREPPAELAAAYSELVRLMRTLDTSFHYGGTWFSVFVRLDSAVRSLPAGTDRQAFAGAAIGALQKGFHYGGGVSPVEAIDGMASLVLLEPDGLLVPLLVDALLQFARHRNDRALLTRAYQRLGDAPVGLTLACEVAAQREADLR